MLPNFGGKIRRSFDIPRIFLLIKVDRVGEVLRFLHGMSEVADDRRSNSTAREEADHGSHCQCEGFQISKPVNHLERSRSRDSMSLAFAVTSRQRSSGGKC